jgi:hypothetical protein
MLKATFPASSGQGDDRRQRRARQRSSR